MKLAPLGSTDIIISQFGLGTVKFGRNQGVKYPQGFDLPSDKDILELLACAKELGINLLDTAPAYGTSEERLGKLLQGQRQEWVLCTKVGEEFVNGESFFDFSQQGMKKSIERSLQRLHTDFLDIVLLHSDGEDKKLIDEGTLEILSSFKKSGLIRAFGMSTKTVDGGKLAVDQSDLVMMTYNPVHTEELPVIEYARQKQKGIFVKKAFASGHYVASQSQTTDPVKAALQFIFQQPGVSSVILGTLNRQHLLQNVQSVVV
jgi:aryl-alcohol dehydrogenase-like predicted oxidoreductase